MQRWMLVFLGLTVPTLGATLKGVVANDEGNAVSQARVMVVHDMALLLAQRRNTDFDGRYHFELDPGPYRIFVLKNGFQPIFSSILIVDEQEEINLNITLTNPSHLNADRADDRATRIKEVYRGSNLNPFLEEEPIILQASLSPREATGFVGQVRTGSRHDLQGQLQHVSTVEVRTMLGDNISLKSSLANEQGGDGEDATQIQAEMMMKTGRMDLGLEAESIRGSQSQEGYSHRARLSSSYGEDFALKTGIQVLATSLADEDQRQTSLEQGLDYEVSGHQLSHNATLTDWRTQESAYAQQLTLTTSWSHQQHPWLALGTEMDQLDLPGQNAQNMSLWVRGNGKNDQKSLELTSQLGYLHGENDQFMQEHNLRLSRGSLIVAASYNDEHNFQALTSGDVFGHYLSKPVTPYAHQSFVDSHSKQLSLDVNVEHGYGWASNMNWQQSSQQGSLLYAHVGGIFRDTAAIQVERFDYALRSETLNATLVLSYSDNQAELASFEQQEITYRQTLFPFRNKGMGLLLELRMQDNPNVPAWWLLQQMPWQPQNNESWYEGHLAFKF